MDEKQRLLKSQENLEAGIVLEEDLSEQREGLKAFFFRYQFMKMRLRNK